MHHHDFERLSRNVAVLCKQIAEVMIRRRHGERLLVQRLAALPRWPHHLRRHADSRSGARARGDLDPPGRRSRRPVASAAFCAPPCLPSRRGTLVYAIGRSGGGANDPVRGSPGAGACMTSLQISTAHEGTEECGVFRRLLDAGSRHG